VIRKFFNYLILIFPLLIPVAGFPFSIGPKIGFGFESWELNSSPYTEKSAYLMDFSACAQFNATQRLKIFLNAGLTLDEKSNQNGISNYFTGATLGWVIHPDYSPFLGASVVYRYYKEVADYENKGILLINFTGGSKILKIGENQSLWLILDYSIFNSEYKKYWVSFFTMSLSYQFEI